MYFKYNINHYTSLMPEGIYPQDVVNQLNKLGISKAEYMKDKNIEKGEPSIIPDERLAIYAKVLLVRVEDLKNDLKS